MTKSEKLSRELFDQIPKHNVKVKFTEDDFCHWDVECTYKDQLFIVELKYRQFGVDDYRFKNGLILEKEKYDYLIEAAQRMNVIPLYVNLLEDRTVCVCKLSELTNASWEEMRMNRYSMLENKQNGDKVYKLVKKILPEEFKFIFKF